MTRTVLRNCGLLSALAAAAAAGPPRIDPADAGMDASRLGAIRPEATAALEAGEFAGCVVAIGRSSGLVYLDAIGDRQVDPERAPMRADTVFDLASLTKPVATATSVIVLVERGRVRLSHRVTDYLPDLKGEGTADVTVDHLLTHAAGYIPDNALADYQDGPDEAWRRLLALPVEAAPGTRFRYSDVGFELLGLLVERVDGRPLDRFAAEEVFAPLGMGETGYLPPPELRARAAASEHRDGRMLVGEVHDPRAALLGGVAGHAGLFSTAEDLATYATAMLTPGSADRVLRSAGVREMIRPRDVAGQLRGAGWDVRSAYSTNRGDFFSDRAFGHGGFTGTAMWIDPELDLYVIFLSNRLHPDGSGSVNDLAGRIGTIAAAAIRDP